jgi:hypothetical protein
LNQQELFIQWNGKFNNFDGALGAQCVDIVKQYFKDVLNLTPINGNAIDYWKDIPGFTLIKNSTFAYPNPGDLIIWKTGEFGHIGICNWVRVHDLSVFEQNNPIGSPCHFGVHDYKNIVGWLSPKVKSIEAPRPTPQSQDRIIIKMVYLSDTDDIMFPAAYCAAKLEEFTGKRLSLEYEFKKITPVNSQPGLDLPQETSSKIVENQQYDTPFHWAVLGYYGNSSSAGYYTATSFVKNIWYTSGYKTFSKETLLFELKHFCVKFYDQHRGTNPYIDNYDNYKSADGGVAKVEEQIKQLIPYLSVFKL